MKKKCFIFFMSLILISTIFVSKAEADEIIQPINNTYKAGIYKLDSGTKEQYNLTYEFVDKSSGGAIIILDDRYDIQYKNINCQRRCNAGIISGKSTIVVLGSGEVVFSFAQSN